jgi:hypothetical protein
MSKFNTKSQAKPLVTGPIQTNAQPTGRTYNGAPGFERDAKGELFLLAVANMVGDNTFYESAADRDARFAGLVRQVAVEDTAWFARFVAWLRGPEGNMRSASLVAAAEGVKALLDAKSPVAKRGIVSSVLQRADEPGEFIAYWMGQYGRNLPKPVKRGINDAIQRLYNEYGTLKYDTQSSGIRFADVIALTHPEPVAPWQDHLFGFINARRWGREDEFSLDETGLMMIRARKIADAMDRDRLLADDQIVRDAGYTWENIAGQGKMDARAWEAVIPSMGIFALLRNLRNFDQAGISDAVADQVRAKLKDPEVIAKSKLMPFRFLSAYQAVKSENWGRELETALNLSMANVPFLYGRTLILVDRSGSMFTPASGSLSDMSRADVAALFAMAVGRRAEYADVVQFGSTYRGGKGYEKVSLDKGGSVLKSLGQFREMGGTDTERAVVGSFKPGFHDRMLVITDEQATYWGGRGTIGDAGVYGSVPETVPIVTWNLAGYQYGHAPGGKNRFTIGGLTDAAFKIVPLLEAGRNANWDDVFGK